jgi:hypothetical protein
MGKQKRSKGVRKDYKEEIKFPVRKICGHCGKRMTRDYFDIVKYKLGDIEFCSNECYANYVNQFKLESIKSIAK